MVLLDSCNFLHNFEDISDDDFRLGQMDEMAACLCYDGLALRSEGAVGTHELLPEVLHFVSIIS